MNNMRSAFAACSLAVVSASLMLVAGCSKKSDVEPAATAADAPKSAVKEDPMMAQNLQAVQKDLSAKEFERAAASMMQMQQMVPVLSEKDAARYNAQMRNLQGTVAAAAANGDPKAQNAATMLRLMSRENQMPMRR